ncbi:MAG TPA: hypothetical protein DCE56_30815, partial [Cyanobacteria bacterium UBA8553]|nr:hypothetical protein [Cyanobacteria bacterium UBA8553]
LVMPVMDGFEATRQLRQTIDLKDMIVIAASASAFDQDHRQSLAAGCNDFISKPIRIEELLERLKRHLRLEWVYESKENCEESNVDFGESRFSINPAVMVIPPDEKMKVLYKLALIGDVIALQEKATKLEQLEEKFKP